MANVALNAGVTLQQLYGSQVSAAQLQQLEEMGKDGQFTDEEIAKIRQMGIDPKAILDNSAAVELNTNQVNVAQKVAELKSKYGADKGSGDSYKMSNPQLKMFQKAMDDGLLDELGKEGYSKEQIIDVISQVFPSIGIKATDKGGYSLPKGHDAEAKKLYDSFAAKLMEVAGTSPEIQALQTEIASLNLQITSNNQQLNVLKGTVEKLQAEIEQAIEEAIQESEEIAEEQKQAAADIVKAELRNYTSSQGQMSYKTFQSNLSNKLDALSSDGSSRISEVVLKMVNAEAKMNTLRGCVDQIGALLAENDSLSTQVQQKVADVAKLKAELCGQEDPDCQRCDPIGFTAGDARYDFFVDKDGDGALSNEKEFLGADSGWDEMAKLDTNGDGKVDKSEMSGLKMVVTNADGTQAVKNASEVFADTDSINLKSYNAVNTNMSNGNTLLGTYGLTFNGQEINDGYNTLDKLSWLDTNYSFSDKDKGIGRFAKDEFSPVDAADFADIYEEFKSNLENLDLRMTEAWSKLGINRADVQENIAAMANAEATAEGRAIEEQFERIKKAEEEELIEQQLKEQAEEEKADSDSTTVGATPTGSTTATTGTTPTEPAGATEPTSPYASYSDDDLRQAYRNACEDGRQAEIFDPSRVQEYDDKAEAIAAEIRRRGISF